MSDVKEEKIEYNWVIFWIAAICLFISVGGFIAALRYNSFWQYDLAYYSAIVGFSGLIFYGLFYSLMRIEKHLRELLKK
jgi:hypothetical protein